MGLTCYGRTPKIHAVVVTHRNMICFQFFSNVINNSVIVEAVLRQVNLNGTIIWADKAYGYYDLRECINSPDAEF